MKPGGIGRVIVAALALGTSGGTLADQAAAEVTSASAGAPAESAADLEYRHALAER